MTSNQTVYRQLTDIQLQAKKLVSGNPEDEELMAFRNYNEDLKHYLLINTEDEEIRSLINEIPDALYVQEETSSIPLYAIIILALLTLGLFAIYIHHLTGMRRTRLIQQNIHTIRGKYASIEFLMKAQA